MSGIIDGEDIFYPARSTILSIEKMPQKLPEQQEGEAYFQSPKVEGNEAVRFVSPIMRPEDINKDEKVKGSILEELLPSHLLVNENVEEPRSGLTDVFGVLFKACFGGWVLASIALFLYSPRVTGVSGLWAASNWFLLVLAVALTGAFVWARLLASQTEAIVYGTATSIPIASMLLAVYMLGNGVIGTLMAGSLMLLAGFSAIILWYQRHELQTSVGIMKTGAQFMNENPEALRLCAQLSITYAVFILFWLGSFCRLISVSSSRFLRLYFVAVLLWTSALIGGIQKFLIGSAVSAWMNDEEIIISDWNSVQERFGSLALASLILAATRFARLTAKALHLTASRLGAGSISSIFNRISEAIERNLGRFTDYVLYYLAANKDSDFWSACSGVARAFSDRPSLSLTVDVISQLLLQFATILVAITSTALLYYLTAHKLTITNAALLGLLCFLGLDLVAAIFTSSIDAVFLNHLLCPPERRKSDLNSAFSSKFLLHA